MSDRKRKREVTGNERPRKKTATRVSRPPQDPSGLIKISYRSNPTATKPILITAPGLELQDSIAFRAYENPSHELLLQANPHASSNLEYVGHQQGTSFDSNGRPTSTYTDYVGVFDPQTNNLHILPALPVEVRRSFRPTVKEIAQEASQSLQENGRIQRQRLGLEFGTKKAKKIIESRTTNAIQSTQAPTGSQSQDGPQSQRSELDDPVTRAVLQSMSEKLSEMPSIAEMQKEADDAKPRPRPNLEAENLEDVYPVETLIGIEELTLVDVKEWEQAVKKNQPIKTHSRFVSERVVKIVAEADPVKPKALRYLLGLIEYYQSLMKSFGGRVGSVKKVPELLRLRTALGMGDLLIGKINAKFSKDKKTSDKWHQEYLLTHICALALYLENFETETFDLLNDLNLDTKQLTSYFREVGATVKPLTESDQQRLGLSKTAASQRRMARLRLPLAFPKLARGRRK